MREFGGWSKPAPEPQPQPEPQPVSKPAPEKIPDPRPDLMRVAADKGEKRSFKLTDLSGDTIRFRPVREEDLREAQEPPRPAGPVEMPEEPAQPAPDRQQQREEAR